MKLSQCVAASQSRKQLRLRCLSKVPTESLLLWRCLGKSFHRCGPATPNDCSPNMVLQHL